MRLYAGLFLCATLIISAALLISGYLLITSSHTSALEREVDRARNQFQYEKFTMRLGLISNRGSLDDALFLNLSGLATVFSEDRALLYTNFLSGMDISIPDDASEVAIVHEFKQAEENYYIVVSGKLTQSGTSIYLMTAVNINEVIALRAQMTESFFRVYLITLGLSMLVVLILSVFITKPINRMNRIAAEIARGRYDKKLITKGNSEISELAESFNIMSDAIEEKINELSNNALQKEVFMANFAHELKTPLTSVIGYADMLYQKTFSPKQTKEAAWYILSEGLRLEALSLKLMELIILNREDFILEEMSSEELLNSIEGSLKPLFATKKVSLNLNVEPQYVLVEYDLFKTLILNLIDNAIKAGANQLKIIGKKEGGRYSIYIVDNGRGIPPDELDKITEAFYMVDKSRSRKQHGTGLGLALAERIAGIHGTTLEFVSKEDTGTAVKMALKVTDNEPHSHPSYKADSEEGNDNQK